MAQEPPTQRPSAGARTSRRQRPIVLVAVFAAAAALVVGLAYWAWRGQASAMREQAQRSVKAVGKLKADQIASWLQERRGDAQILSGDRLLASALSDLAEGRNAPATAGRVRSYLAEFKRVYSYTEVGLLDQSGRPVMSVPAGSAETFIGESRALAAEALRTRAVAVSDLYLDAGGEVRLELAAPVLALQQSHPPLGCVVLVSDPHDFLFPYIQTWPFPSGSGETLLVERKGGRAVYLNDLRFRTGTALKLTTPLAAPHLPAAMAARGVRGVVSGTDYRGVPVFAALEQVPGTHWQVVSKVDSAEIIGPIALRGWLTAGFTLLVVAVTATATILLWRARESRTTAELRESEAQFHGLFENMTEGVALHELVFDASGDPADYRVLDINPAFEAQTDIVAQDVRGRLASDAYGTGAPPFLEAYTQTAMSGAPHRFETYFAPLEKHFDITVVAYGSGLFATVFEDVTERLRAQHELRETRDYLESLLDYANAPIIVWDPELRITRFNHASEDLTHLSGDEVVGRHIELLFPEDERRAQALEHIISATAGERWQVVEIPILRADGVVRTVLWNSATVYEPDGVKPVATIAQGQDVTERLAAERELRDSEDKFRYFFERSVVGMSLTLPDGELRVNDAFCRMLGYSRDELDTRTWQNISHLDDVADTQRHIAELMSGTADDVRFVKRYVCKDGAVVWADVATTLRRDDDGAPLYFMTAVVDITERVRAGGELRDSEERLRFLVDQTPTVNWTLDTELTFTLSRGAGLHTLGLEPDEVVGMYVGDYLGGPSAQADLGVAMHKRALAGESFVYEQPVGDLTFDIMLGPLRGGAGAIIGVIGVGYDTTARKDAEKARREAERKLTQLNAELEQRVEDRTAQLDAANKELEAFAYSVSHDLRAPLRHISGFSALLAERAGDSLDEKSHHYLGTISRSVAEMGKLIDDLLQFSRSGRAEMHIAPVDMDEVLREALGPLRREAGGREIEWSIGALPRVVGDHALLRQVWANLLGNAVKYTRGRTPAHIEVGAHDGDGSSTDEHVFWVRDDGVGFDMQYAHKLFGVFQRLHTASEFEGTGIGLANVQRIVARLGGRVWAEGEPGNGATFFFSLPRRKDTPS